jgi:hypothetical protein
MPALSLTWLVFDTMTHHYVSGVTLITGGNTLSFALIYLLWECKFTMREGQGIFVSLRKLS